MTNVCSTYFKGLYWKAAPCPCHIYWMSSALRGCCFAVGFSLALSRKQRWHKMETEAAYGLRLPAATGLHRGTRDTAGKNELMPSG